MKSIASVALTLLLATQLQGAFSLASPVEAATQVTICHNGSTQSVSASAVAGHLGHGDTLGACGSSSSSSSSSSVSSSSSSSVSSSSSSSSSISSSSSSSSSVISSSSSSSVSSSSSSASSEASSSSASSESSSSSISSTSSSSSSSSSSENSEFQLAVCHDGQTTMVAIGDIITHVLHGDAIGECSSSSSSSSSTSSSSSSSSSVSSSSSSSASPESSSSSSSASSESSSSSVSSQNEGGDTPTITASSQDEGEQGSNGGTRGHGLRYDTTAAQNIGGNVDLPLPAVGGGRRAALLREQTAYICSMQRRPFAKKATLDYIQLVAKTMKNNPLLANMTEEMVVRYLLDKGFCADEIAQRLPGYVAVAQAFQKPITVNAQGFPVSENSTFNACFRSTYGSYVLVKEDIKNNPMKDKDGTPYDCAYYNANSSNVWNMPYGKGSVTVTFDPITRTLTVPSDYILVKDVTLASK